MARRLLTDLAGAELEQRIVITFIERLEWLEHGDRERISDSDARSAIVRSGFPVPDELRARLEAALHRHLPADVEARFEVAPELVCGVEVVLGSHKITWAVADYLGTLEEEVLRTLEAGSGGRSSSSEALPEGAPREETAAVPNPGSVPE